MLCCLVLGSMVVPLKSRRQLAAGLLSLAFAGVVLLALRRKGLALGLDSMRGLMTAMVMASPAVFGFALLAAHLLSRRRQSAIVANATNVERLDSISRPFAAGCAGLVAGVAPFVLLVYRAAEYRMPDSYIWGNRVNPDAGWPFIGFCSVVGIIALGASHWKSVRSAGARRVPVGEILPLLAIVLGAVFFARAGLVDKPNQFTRALVCLDGENGAILWVCEGLTGSAKGRSRTVTHASATPATDGKRVFASVWCWDFACCERQHTCHCTRCQRIRTAAVINHCLRLRDGKAYLGKRKEISRRICRLRHAARQVIERPAGGHSPWLA